jgi:hypothetical protein
MSWVDVTTAVGTASAAVIALGLGLRAEWRATRLERKLAGEEDRRQAVHVAAWMLVEQYDEDGAREVLVDDPSMDWRKVRVYEVIQNASDEPIWDVVVRATVFKEKNEGSDELEIDECEDEIMSIGPHETHKSQITIMTLPYNRFPLKISFRDNAGREWHRDDRGRLQDGRIFEASWSWIDKLAEEKSAQEKSHQPTRRRSAVRKILGRGARPSIAANNDHGPTHEAHTDRHE